MKSGHACINWVRLRLNNAQIAPCSHSTRFSSFQKRETANLHQRRDDRQIAPQRHHWPTLTTAFPATSQNLQHFLILHVLDIARKINNWATTKLTHRYQSSRLVDEYQVLAWCLFCKIMIALEAVGFCAARFGWRWQ